MSSTASPKPLHIDSSVLETDRRRRERMATTAIGYLLPDGVAEDAEPWEVRVGDVSRLGVGFTSSEQMVAGAICRIRIGYGPMRLARRMRVVSCRADGRGLWHIGAEFA